MARRYFDNLNGLRFFAAITVAISHLETIKSYQNKYFIVNRFIENSAQLSVTFFFVLSGFLISWWFLEETKGGCSRINIKTFYLKRFSRTWPLYFLIIFFSLLIGIYSYAFKHDIYFPNRFVAYLLFLPNTADLSYKADIHLGQTWSLAVEEFFYFLFPLFLISIKKRFLKQNFMFLFFVFLILSIILNPIFIHHFYEKFAIPQPHTYIVAFFERYRMYTFLSGSFAAWFFYHNENQIRYLVVHRFKLLSTLLIICTLLFFLFGITFSFLTHQGYSILFSFIILYFVCTEKSYWLLTNKLISLGGKYSYGIYMLHMFVIMRLTNQGAFLYEVGNRNIGIIISWILVIVVTFIVSHFSYTLFERPVQQRILKRFAKSNS